MDPIKKPARDKVFGISSRRLLTDLSPEVQKAVKMIFEQNQDFKEIPLDIFFYNICSIMGAEFVSRFFGSEDKAGIQINASFYQQIDSICQSHNILPFKIKIKTDIPSSKDIQNAEKVVSVTKTNIESPLFESKPTTAKQEKKTEADSGKNISENHYTKLPGEDIDECFV